MTSEKFWNRLSKSYDKLAKDKTYDMILAKSRTHLKVSDSVLDFGCATGLYTFALSENVGKIYGIDTADQMIAHAKKKLETENINNISFARTTIFDQSLLDEKFEVILAFNILLYFKEPYKVVSRMNELLKKDGIIISSTACLNEKRNFFGILSSCIIYLLSNLKILPNMEFLKIKQLEKKFLDNGFIIVQKDVLIDKPATECFIVAKKCLSS